MSCDFTSIVDCTAWSNTLRVLVQHMLWGTTTGLIPSHGLLSMHFSFLQAQWSLGLEDAFHAWHWHMALLCGRNSNHLQVYQPMLGMSHGTQLGPGQAKQTNHLNHLKECWVCEHFMTKAAPQMLDYLCCNTNLLESTLLVHI